MPPIRLLNSGRAGVRATDENVAQAKSGYRPTVSLDADIGLTQFQGRRSGFQRNQVTRPGGAGLTVNQTLFNGFRTDNQARQAESDVLRARETLRNTEMNTLFNAAQSYMNVLRDTANLELQRNNVEVLEEQLRQTRDRFNVGEVTRTDVAQAEARLAGARSERQRRRGEPARQHRHLPPVHRRRAAPARAGPAPRPLRAAAASMPRSTSASRSTRRSSRRCTSVDVAEPQVKVLEGALVPDRRPAGLGPAALRQPVPRRQRASAPRSSAA